MINEFKPFQNDTQSVSIGNHNGLTIENGTEEIILYGDISISKNSEPANLDKIIDLLKNIKSALEPVKNQKLKNN